MGKSSSSPKPQRFEDALARLEEIAVILDRNDTLLADALALCAEAAELTRFCRAQLSDAEGQLARLVETNGGDATVQTFEME